MRRIGNYKRMGEKQCLVIKFADNISRTKDNEGGEYKKEPEIEPPGAIEGEGVTHRSKASDQQQCRDDAT